MFLSYNLILKLFLRKNTLEKKCFSLFWFSVKLVSILKIRFEKSAKRTKELLNTYAETSENIKKVCGYARENILAFLLECDSFAQKMSGTIIIVHQKDFNRIFATIVCDEILFRENEIESLIKICAFTTKIEFSRESHTVKTVQPWSFFQSFRQGVYFGKYYIYNRKKM